MYPCRSRHPVNKTRKKKKEGSGAPTRSAYGRSRSEGNHDRSMRPMSVELRWKVIAAYGLVLERCSAPIERESELPFPKVLIKQAIYEELLENPQSSNRNRLEIAYVQIESFLPVEEYEVIHNFKDAFTLAEETAKSGEPGDLLASARILAQTEGDRAVRIQERISERMRAGLARIKSVGSGRRRCFSR